MLTRRFRDVVCAFQKQASLFGQDLFTDLLFTQTHTRDKRSTPSEVLNRTVTCTRDNDACKSAAYSRSGAASPRRQCKTPSASKHYSALGVAWHPPGRMALTSTNPTWGVLELQSGPKFPSRQLRMGGIQARYGITAPILVLSANVATYGAEAQVCDMELEATTSPKCDMELGNEIPNPSSPPPACRHM